MILLQDWELRRGGITSVFIDCHFFPTYFPDEDSSDIFSKVNSTQDRSDLTAVANSIDTSQKRIFIPFCKNSHWVLVVVEIAERKIIFYDSLCRDGSERVFFDRVLRFLVHVGLSSSNWTEVKMSKSLPTQGSDTDECGVFVMMYIDFLVDGLPLDFLLQDAAHFRRKVFADFYRGHLLYGVNETLPIPFYD